MSNLFRTVAPPISYLLESMPRYQSSSRKPSTRRRARTQSRWTKTTLKLLRDRQLPARWRTIGSFWNCFDAVIMSSIRSVRSPNAAYRWLTTDQPPFRTGFRCSIRHTPWHSPFHLGNSSSLTPAMSTHHDAFASISTTCMAGLSKVLWLIFTAMNAKMRAAGGPLSLGDLCPCVAMDLYGSSISP